MARQAEILFSAYRAADYADAKGFAVQLATILSEFPEEVVLHVTSPHTGIQRRSKWPPTISEVLEACEHREDFLRKVKEQRPLNPNRIAPPSTLRRPPGYLANVHVPEWHPRYARLAEWTKTVEEKFWRFGPNNDGEPGLWLPLNVWQDGVPAPPRKQQEIPRDLTLTPETKAAMAQRIEPESVTAP